MTLDEESSSIQILFIVLQNSKQARMSLNYLENKMEMHNQNNIHNMMEINISIYPYNMHRYNISIIN